MKTSKEIYPESRREEVYEKYSPELDKCIDALRAAEGEEEKKPLYVNQYGTEFFDGDECWYVEKQKIEPQKSTIGKEGAGWHESQCWSELLTQRECHRWIDEHWDELNK